MIYLFPHIAFSLYLIDVKGPRTNLLRIHYICIIGNVNSKSACFRVIITDESIKHNMYDPKRCTDGISVMPYRFYKCDNSYNAIPLKVAKQTQRIHHNAEMLML